MGYALVQNGLSLTRAGFSLKMGARRDDLWEAPPGWPRGSWEEDNSAASTGRYPSGHGEQGRAGKESVNIHNLPGKGRCKAKIGPGCASAEEEMGVTPKVDELEPRGTGIQRKRTRQA